MTQFREHNPIPVAVAGLVVLLLILYVAFNAGNIAALGGGGSTYHAAFTEASDVKVNDDVRIAGIKIGHVTSVKLAGDHVRVAMKLDPGTAVGSDTRADIRIKTLLGAMYVALTPAGPGKLSTRTDIPTSRTTTPLIVTTAFEGLASRIDSIDTNQLATAFDTLSTDFKDTPSQVSKTLKGLSALSHTISSRDQQLQTLLGHAQGVTAALASRDEQVTKLIDDGRRC